MNQMSRQLLPEKFPDSWASAWGEDMHGLWAAFEVGGIQQKMRWIAPGVFLMGDELTDTEKKAVSVQGFWLAETTCTQALYVGVVGDNPSRFDGEQKPVEQVSFEDVQRFNEKVNRMVEGLHCRLPSESEWEYACRAGTKSPYWFGETIDQSQARFGWITNQNDKLQGSVQVTGYNANSWGLYQMHGNVWEWCQDWYGDDKDDRVVRGGCWIDDAESLRSGLRGGYSPDGRSDYLGFRLARGQ